MLRAIKKHPLRCLKSYFVNSSINSLSRISNVNSLLIGIY
nr:MAG TPA: hypothetical protein [Caudoviricetes sp.]